MRKGKKTKNLFIIIVSLLIVLQLVPFICLAGDVNTNNALSSINLNDDLETTKTPVTESNPILTDTDYTDFQELLKIISITNTVSTNYNNKLKSYNTNEEVDSSVSSTSSSLSSASTEPEKTNDEPTLSTNEYNINKDLIKYKEEFVQDKDIEKTSDEESASKTEYYSSSSSSSQTKNTLRIEYFLKDENKNSYEFTIKNQNGETVSDVSVYIAGKILKTNSKGIVIIDLPKVDNKYIIKCYAEGYSGNAITINTYSSDYNDFEATNNDTPAQEKSIFNTFLEYIKEKFL